MNLTYISWRYLTAKPLNTFLNILILSLGIALVVVLLLASHQLEEKLDKHAKGIDLVVGAKGSPLQLVLCNLFHVDFPTGNIPLHEARKLASNPMVKKAIPLALGDSYGSFRIVGTSEPFVEHYALELAEGKWWWESEMGTTLGHSVAQRLQLKIGDTFFGAHGMEDAVGDIHDDHAYTVMGICQPSGSVADNLIMTQIESVWKVHEHAEEVDSVSPAPAPATMGQMAAPKNEVLANFPVGDSTREITSMLVKFKSPMAAITMPRMINGQTNMQAASPAFETARLFSILGVGIDLFKAFAYLMVLIAVMSIFIALYNTMKEKKYDLAVIRSLGASQQTLFLMVVLEGVLLTSAGAVLGTALAHGSIEAAAFWLDAQQKAGFTGKIFLVEEIYVILATVLIGKVTALLPAWQAYRTDISRVLSEG